MTKSTPIRRTQAERTRARREQIIRAAIDFFSQQGYRGAKLSAIAAAAGVTEPGLLHHFPSKAHLLMEVLAERDRVDRERFNPDSRKEAGNTLDSLHQLVEYNQTVPGLVQLFTTLVAESVDENHPGHDFFMRRYQAVREQEIGILELGQARGEVRSDIPAEDLAVLIFALMDGLQVQWLLEPDKVDMARVFGQFIRLLKGEKVQSAAPE